MSKDKYRGCYELPKNATKDASTYRRPYKAPNRKEFLMSDEATPEPRPDQIRAKATFKEGVKGIDLRLDAFIPYYPETETFGEIVYCFRGKRERDLAVNSFAAIVQQIQRMLLSADYCSDLGEGPFLVKSETRTIVAETREEAFKIEALMTELDGSVSIVKA